MALYHEISLSLNNPLETWVPLLSSDPLIIKWSFFVWHVMVSDKVFPLYF